MDAGIELRPRSTSEIVDAAVELVRGHYLGCVMIAAIISAPAIAYAQVQFGVMMANGPANLNYRAAFMSFFVTTAFGAINQAAQVAALSRTYLGEPFDAGGALITAVKRTVPLLAATILQGLAVVAGLVALIVPGLYIGVRTYCLQAIVVIEPEHSSPFAIFGRAWRLSEKDGMPIFLAACLSIVLVIAGVVAATAIALGLGAIVPALHEPRMRQLVQSALMCFIAPVPPAVMTVLYYDLRIRREGLDLEIGSKSLALEAPPA